MRAFSKAAVLIFILSFISLSDAVAGGLVARDLDVVFAFRRAALREIFGGR